MNKTHRLCLILGDQLSFDLASLKGLDSERDLLRSNQRMGMGMGMVYKNLDRMNAPKQQALWDRGQKLLAKLDAGVSF
jgi:deoxyribodipyrimidine photolyase-like uncharacterized protein